MIIKIIKELRKRTDEQSHKQAFLNKDLENIKKNQTDLKNMVSEVKSTLE